MSFLGGVGRGGNNRHDFEDRYFLDALSFLEEAECALNVGVCGFSAAPLALARKNGFDIASNLVRKIKEIYIHIAL